MCIYQLKPAGFVGIILSKFVFHRYNVIYWRRRKGQEKQKNMEEKVKADMTHYGFCKWSL